MEDLAEGQTILTCPRCYQPIDPTESHDDLGAGVRAHRPLTCIENLQAANAMFYQAATGKSRDEVAALKAIPKPITNQEAASMTPEQYLEETKKRQAEAVDKAEKDKQRQQEAAEKAKAEVTAMAAGKQTVGEPHSAKATSDEPHKDKSSEHTAEDYEESGGKSKKK